MSKSSLTHRGPSTHDYSDIPPLFDQIDWSRCPDAERIPGKLSGAWCVKGHRVRCEDITGQFEAGCSAEDIAGPDIYPGIPLEVVRRILAFARARR